MFDKPIYDFVYADINRLIQEKVIEGIHIEFKESLPSRKGNDLNRSGNPGDPLV